MSGRSDSGFTLIELLVAMTLLGLLSVALVAGFRSGLRAWETSTRIANQANDLRRTEDQVRRALERAYPALVSIDATHVRADFAGSETSMAFLTPAGDGNLMRTRLEITGPDGDRTLWLAAIPELATPGIKPRTKVLLSHLARADFAYASDTEWQKSWTDAIKLPRSIRIHLEAQGSGTPLDIVVEPCIAADIGCVFDLLTHSCAGR
jgi:general secretion pathway protein J